MNKFIFAGILFSLTAAAATEPQFLAADQVEKTYGTSAFDAKKFKSGDQKTRAGMAADLVKKNVYAGKSVSTVAEELGAPDGHYMNAEPAFTIGSDGADLLQLVFLRDESGKNVADVKVHRRFCSATPPEPPQVTSKKAGKKLQVHITGEVAAAIYGQMSKIEREGATRLGDNITCSKPAKGEAKCTLAVDENGEVEAK